MAQGIEDRRGMFSISFNVPKVSDLSFSRQRQFHRLIEMLIQLHLNPADARAIKAYRLQVKERLYRFNYVSIEIYHFG